MIDTKDIIIAKFESPRYNPATTVEKIETILKTLVVNTRPIKAIIKKRESLFVTFIIPVVYNIAPIKNIVIVISNDNPNNKPVSLPPRTYINIKDRLPIDIPSKIAYGIDKKLADLGVKDIVILNTRVIIGDKIYPTNIIPPLEI